MLHSNTKERIISGPQQSCNAILSLHPAIFEDGCLEENMITTTTPEISLGDGVLRCKEFPCPVCNQGRAAIQRRKFRSSTMIMSAVEPFPGQISMSAIDPYVQYIHAEE